MRTKLFLLVAMIFIAMMAPATAGATLSQVGPTLSENPSQAAAQIQTLLRHDQGVQAFLGIRAQAAAQIQVVEARAIVCKIGTRLCPFNTGKAGWRLQLTSYRWGDWRPSYRAKFIMGPRTAPKTYYVTVHKLSSNILSKLTLKRVRKPKRIRVTRKAITIRLIAVADASSASGQAQEITCPANTIAKARAHAWSGASSLAAANVKYVRVKAGRKAWTKLLRVARVFADATADSDASATVECVPVDTPPTCPSGTTGSYPDCVPTCPPGNTWDRTKRQCVKDGSTTPPSPPEAPGPNPQPSPSDPAPGGHQCYSETTGRAVDPLPDGRCPVGSYGA